jgi:hypothetical protein
LRKRVVCEKMKAPQSPLRRPCAHRHSAEQQSKAGIHHFCGGIHRHGLSDLLGRTGRGGARNRKHFLSFSTSYNRGGELSRENSGKKNPANRRVAEVRLSSSMLTPDIVRSRILPVVSLRGGHHRAWLLPDPLGRSIRPIRRYPQREDGGHDARSSG